MLDPHDFIEEMGGGIVKMRDWRRKDSDSNHKEKSRSMSLVNESFLVQQHRPERVPC